MKNIIKQLIRVSPVRSIIVRSDVLGYIPFKQSPVMAGVYHIRHNDKVFAFHDNMNGYGSLCAIESDLCKPNVRISGDYSKMTQTAEAAIALAPRLFFTQEDAIREYSLVQLDGFENSFWADGEQFRVIASPWETGFLCSAIPKVSE